MGVSVMSLLAHGASPGPEPDRRERPRTLALWSFDEGSGRVVYDRSGAVRPLDLRVGRAARWTGPGLSLRDGSALTSVRPARALLAVGRRGGVTVEMWLRPEAMPRSRPLLSLAKAGDSRRRVLLAAKTLPRLGTTVFARTGPAGSHSRRLVATAAPDRFAHLVWTRTAGGTESLFVDGRRAARAKVGRDPLPGAGRWRLVIGGGSGAGWQGELLRVKVLDRALRPAQVARDHRNEPVPPAPRPATSDRPLLIKHGWDMPSPGYVRDHIDEMERLPFDGLTIAVPGLGDKVQRQTPVSYERFRDALAPLRSTRSGRLRHNFAAVYATPAGSVFDDWSVPVSNFANLARAAREVGLEGILFDNEGYFGDVSNYPGVCPGHSLTGCQDQARLRGRQILDAMRAVWPDVRVMSLYGPWVSEPRTSGALSPLMPFNDVSAANELTGSFFVGMVESAAGTPARVIDGGEIYSARTAAQFAAITRWQTQGMAEQSPLVPPALSRSWSSTVLPAVGVYDQPWLGTSMDVDTFGGTVGTALAGRSSYVWVYTEKHDWWGSGWPRTAVPRSWVDAVAAAATR